MKMNSTASSTNKRTVQIKLNCKMKKNTILSLFVTLILYHGVYAQQDSIFNLDKCIDYAFKNQATVKNAELDQQISKYKINETRGNGLPQINFEANTMYNIALQAFFLTNGNASKFGYPISSTANPSDIYAGKQVFQLNATNTATLNATQILFDGSYLVGLKASKMYSELASRSITQTKIETIDKITKAFYLVLINEQQLQLLNANISRIDTSLNQLKEINKSGFAENLDVNRLEVTLNNLKTDQLNVQNQLLVTYSLLKYQMSYPSNSELKLTGTLDELVTRLNTASNPNLGGDFNYNQRNDYSLLRTQKKLQELNLKNAYAISYPKLVAFGTAGMINSQNDYMKLYSTPYYGYGYIGAKLSVPIFTGGNHYFQQQGAKLEVRKAQNNIEMMEDVIDLQVQQTKLVMDNNIQNIKLLISD